MGSRSTADAAALSRSQNLGVSGAGGSGSFRRLLDSCNGNLPEEAAAQVLMSLGITDFGTIVHRSRAPTCPLDGLPASARGQLFSFCSQNAATRNCTRPAAQELGSSAAPHPPLYQLSCENSTCVELLTPLATACLLPDATSGVDAMGNASEGDCKVEFGIVDGQNRRNASAPFKPGMLRRMGTGRSVFDCILGLPAGSGVLTALQCVEGALRLETIVTLGGPPIVPPGVPFRCMWDGRCRGEEGCCEGGAIFRSYFICYVPGWSGMASAAVAADSAAGGWLLALVVFTVAIFVHIVV